MYGLAQNATLNNVQTNSDFLIPSSLLKGMRDIVETDFSDVGFMVRNKVYYTPPQPLRDGKLQPNQDPLYDEWYTVVIERSIEDSTQRPYIIHARGIQAINDAIKSIKRDQSYHLIEVSLDTLTPAFNRCYYEDSGIKCPNDKNPIQLFTGVVRDLIMTYFTMVWNFVNMLPQDASDMQILQDINNYQNNYGSVMKNAYSKQFIHTSGVVVDHIIYFRQSMSCEFKLSFVYDLMRIVKNDHSFI